ncbi:hypothetical protein DICA1_E24014 [Diutina catenulata]
MSKRPAVEDDFFAVRVEKKKKKKRSHKSPTPIADSPTAAPQNVPILIDAKEDEKIVKSASPERLTRSTRSKTKSLVDEPVPSTRLGSEVTAPVIDREKLRALIAQRHQAERTTTEEPARSSSPDIQEMSPHEGSAQGSFSGSFSSPREPSAYEARPYLIKITSKLHVPEGATNSITFQVRGTKKFRSILPSALANFQKRFGAEASKEYEDPEGVALVWVERTTVVRPSYSASFFRLPPKDGKEPDMNLLLIPKKNTDNFEFIYPEFNYGDQVDLSETDFLDSKDSQSVELVTEAPPPEETFVIGIKGADNKRIDMEVSPSTPISNLLAFYLKAKSMDPATKARLVFDDEEMAFTDKVGDTELEEEFEVQVELI